jgi:hypothetical protein
MFDAICHCGNVVLTTEKLPETVTSCNCSICNRYGAIWAYFKPEQVTVVCNQVPTHTYSWAEKVIDFHHCPICGCVTHHTTTARANWTQVAINTRMFDPAVTKDIPVRKFDGADTWTYIE